CGSAAGFEVHQLREFDIAAHDGDMLKPRRRRVQPYRQAGWGTRAGYVGGDIFPARGNEQERFLSSWLALLHILSPPQGGMVHHRLDELAALIYPFGAILPGHFGVAIGVRNCDLQPVELHARMPAPYPDWPASGKHE